MWRLADGAETCRDLALWALQMKHTRFSRKKNASTAAAAITRDQGTWIYRGWMENSYLVLHEKTLCNRLEGVSLNKQMREKGIQAQ